MASFVEVGGHAGDEGNFEALYETYKHDVQRLASYLLKNASDAEDAAQTVFMNVLRALRQGVTPADPRAWLLAITRNVCFSRGRAAAARPDYVELDHETPSQPGDDEAPSAEEIVGALTRMRPNQRTALILRDFRGVSRSEISDLMALSSVSVEALLTRARSSFREELEAGDQPFVCEETRALVEQQLDGEITVADRHSLRTHLRHCAPCSTLARAVRSSRGKLAGLIFWPAELVSRLASALSQAPTVAHVAAAITSTAAVATVAIPVAITNAPSTAHVEGRTAPAASVPAFVAPAAATPRAAPAASPVFAAARVASRTIVHRVASAATHKATHATKHAVHHAAPKHVATASAAPVTHASPAATTTGPVQTPATQEVTHQVVVQPAPSSVTEPNVSQPRASQPITTPRSSSPSARPTSKPHAKPAAKPSRKSSKRRGSGHRQAGPPDRMPSSSPPADSLPPADGGATDGAGPGFTPSAVITPAVVAPVSSSSSQGDTGSNGDDNGSGNGKGHGKHHK